MKNRFKFYLLACLALASSAGAAAQSSFSIQVKGDSTLHHWSADATQVEILSPKKGLASKIKAGSLKSLEIKVPVAGLKSSEGASMDKNMDLAMDAAEYGAIFFSLTSYKVQGTEVSAKGVLTIHGVAKDVEFKGSLAGKGADMAIKGSLKLLMSDYRIKPPVMMLGTIRVADEVSIVYNYELGASHD